jgi:hypothetical protein
MTTIASYLHNQIDETIAALKAAQRSIAEGNITIANAKLDTARAEINYVQDRLNQAANR